jgi:hypothetical protein
MKCNGRNLGHFLQFFERLHLFVFSSFFETRLVFVFTTSIFVF